MMRHNTIFKTLGFSCSLILLVACGGGGGGSSSVDYLGQPSISSNNPVSYKVTPPTTQYQAEAQKVIEQTNQLRATQGLPPLKYDAQLAAYAQRRANEIVTRFDHTRPDGSSWSTGIQGGGAENIAAGSETANLVVEQWRKSSGHNANMINSAYTKIGVGLVYSAKSKYGFYWVQIFGMDDTTSLYAFDSTNSTTNTATKANNPLTVLVVNNMNIPLTDIDGSGNWYQIEGNNFVTYANGYASTRFGATKLADKKYHTFHQGVATPESDMPTSSTAKYAGKAIVADADHITHTYTSAQFDADFRNKKLSGQIGSDIKVNANIKGNQFSSATGATVETQGGFYGAQAAELAGQFKDNSSGKIGAFGAKKQ